MTKRKMRITRPQDIRRLLASMINQVKDSEDIPIDKKAQLIATLSNSALRSIEQGDIADRMDEYERQLDEYKRLLEQQRTRRKRGRTVWQQD